MLRHGRRLLPPLPPPHAVATALLALALGAGLLLPGADAALTTYCWQTAAAAFPLDFYDFPAPLPGDNRFAVLAAGPQHVCGLDDAGAAACFGTGEAGQLGDGRSGAGYTAAAPVPVLGGHAFSSISAGRFHT